MLDISHNYIEFIPDSIGDMTKLEMLIANDNILKFLPTASAKLSNLRVLELGDNSLEAFPDAIWKLQNLEELKLSGNNFYMQDSARLVLELPKLRAVSTPAAPGTCTSNKTQEQDDGSSFKVNHQFSPHLKVFWAQLATNETKEISLSSFLEKSYADAHFCLGLLGLTKKHCLDFYVRGTCDALGCQLLHDARVINKKHAVKIIGLLREVKTPQEVSKRTQSDAVEC